MKDTIAEDDLILSEEKTELEKNLEQSKRDKGIIEDRIKSIEEKVDRFIEAITRIEKLTGRL